MKKQKLKNIKWPRRRRTTGPRPERGRKPRQGQRGCSRLAGPGGLWNGPSGGEAGLCQLLAPSQLSAHRAERPVPTLVGDGALMLPGFHSFLDHMGLETANTGPKTEVSKLRPLGQLWPNVTPSLIFSMNCELRIIFTFFKSLEKAVQLKKKRVFHDTRNSNSLYEHIYEFI